MVRLVLYLPVTVTVYLTSSLLASLFIRILVVIIIASDKRFGPEEAEGTTTVGRVGEFAGFSALESHILCGVSTVKFFASLDTSRHTSIEVVELLNKTSDKIRTVVHWLILTLKYFVKGG
jgi:hypothetical protein